MCKNNQCQKILLKMKLFKKKGYLKIISRGYLRKLILKVKILRQVQISKNNLIILKI